MLKTIDTSLTNIIINLRSSWLTDFFLGATYLGNPWPLAVILVVTVLLFWQGGKKRAGIAIFLGTSLAVSLQYLLKVLIVRARPDSLGSLIEVTGYSFPSGHAAVTTTFFLLAGFCLSTLKPLKKYRGYIYGCAFFLAITISLSRVYLGAHWPSDIFAGFIIGLAVWQFIIWLFYRSKLK
ncbi:MAG: hypothetical protein A2571_02330 [Candidatus Vogelbacteria bacterium RIFOXYD1_FULL_44_32]|uniref:Phosphatidic acid phosphatase type 2/haloperoxidase domain-containing protein n=1 Tax=Candidatus Vogelbacteria bacterium RIFOXYD1_FULL_44_32 TaxID=1802438 RepID=A0A1G2QDG3_9BACT|nr:MAG: hypothetical protein A2571_02330 [Candidatus Vogelbacteria bacterium RIFOXYD1_FULL_44_32]